MPEETKELNEYEKLVDRSISRAIKGYEDRLELQKGYDGGGAYWEITPHKSGAAKAYVYGIDENTINITIDDMHWLELFVTKKKWDQSLEIFEKHLHAFFEGKLKGWHVKHTHPGGKVVPMTLLEVDLGDRRPYVWSGNVIFTKRFKKLNTTVSKQCDKY